MRGDGKASPERRQASYENDQPSLPPAAAALIDKVVRYAYKVADDDVAAAKAAGLSEEELFALAVCAAIGAASRQLDAARAAIKAADVETASTTKGAA